MTLAKGGQARGRTKVIDYQCSHRKYDGSKSFCALQRQEFGSCEDCPENTRIKAEKDYMSAMIKAYDEYQIANREAKLQYMKAMEKAKQDYEETMFKARENYMKVIGLHPKEESP